MAAVTYTAPESAEEMGRRISHLDTTSITSDKDCRVYKTRWLMLGIYMLCAVADETHWLHYAITAQTVTKYYGISDYIVDLTSITYGITFVVFVFPAIWLIEKYGLKKMLICGDMMIILASGLKLASLEPETFYVGFVGQILAGIAQVFIVNVPSYLAGLWFPKNEVSTACALGVLGLQVGNALSFFIPPHLIALGEKTPGVEGVRNGLLYVYIYLTILPVVLLPLLIFFFKSQPPKPPSYARIAKPMEEERGKSAFKELAKNRNYILVVVSYSLNVSVFYCMSTMMNQIIPDEKFAGAVGATMIVFGIAGCFFFGWLLDKTHKFKLISLVTYLVSIVGLIMFWASKTWALHKAVYILSGSVIGFFLASYVIISIEFCSELTYPISETISTSILLASGEFISIIFIYVTALLFENYGTIWAIVTTSVFMFMGLIPTSLTRKIRLKRHEASLQPFFPTWLKRSSGMSHKTEDPEESKAPLHKRKLHRTKQEPDETSTKSETSIRMQLAKDKTEPNLSDPPTKS